MSTASPLPVVAAIDLAEMTDYVLAEALAEAAQRQAPMIHVACAIDPSLDVIGVDIELADEVPRLEQALEARVAGPLAGVPHEVHALLGAPATEIVELARRVEAGLIVVGRHSRAQPAAVLGSVPAKILALAHSSVLVVQPTDYATP